jgi:hypothetical protein
MHVRVRSHNWAGQVRQGRQLINVVYHVRQSCVDHRLRVETGMRAHAARRLG